MALIEIITKINAPIDLCFDLSRNIDFHVASTSYTGEKVVAGRTSGFIELGDFVTFSARHLGFRWKLTSRIIEFDRPHKFTDQMIKGPFKDLHHEHIFKEHEGITFMTDRMRMESPLGIIGKAFDMLVLKAYMRKFLSRRCEALRQCLESNERRRYLQ